MFVLVTYDVETKTPAGQKRLRRIAEACLDYGVRVQNSVFECNVEPAEWERLKARLLGIYNADADSVRFYFLGSHWQRRIEHYGVSDAPDVEGVLIM